MSRPVEADWCRQLASQIEDPELRQALSALADDYEREPQAAAPSEFAAFEPAAG